MSDCHSSEHPAPALLSFGRHAPDDPPPLEPSASLETVETETRHYRHDGWTPAARADFLDTLARSGQLHQLRQGKALDEQEDSADDDDGERVWIEDHRWRTNFPPPDDFNGDEQGLYGDLDYSRNCTPEERELLDRRFPDAFADLAVEHRQADEAERDSFFAALAEELTNSSPSATWGGEPFPEEGMVEG